MEVNVVQMIKVIMKQIQFQQWKYYIQLMKPSIMLLVLITGAAALFVEGAVFDQPVSSLIVLLALLLTGGSANAFNQYFERDKDCLMSRTKNRRPLPQGKLTANQALLFAIILMFLSVSIFFFFFNILSALLALFTILFYSFFYTLYLKPRTHQNIVIGGIAGAMAPPIAWAAVTGEVGLPAIAMFAIIFIWTPPHFWALALLFKEDYQKVTYPMLPNVKGDSETRRQIFLYTVALFLISLLPMFFQFGWLYFIFAILLGFFFLRLAFRMWREQSNALSRKMFGYSILYLMTLFVGIIADVLVMRILPL